MFECQHEAQSAYQYDGIHSYCNSSRALSTLVPGTVHVISTQSQTDTKSTLTDTRSNSRETDSRKRTDISQATPTDRSPPVLYCTDGTLCSSSNLPPLHAAHQPVGAMRQYVLYVLSVLYSRTCMCASTGNIIINTRPRGVFRPYCRVVFQCDRRHAPRRHVALLFWVVWRRHLFFYLRHFARLSHHLLRPLQRW